jgi:DNA-directed RNA polymerase subunit K/omega
MCLAMDYASEAPAGASGSTPPGSPFAITLKGWRSQLRWAMTQREEDPARVWLEIISIDERSKRALNISHDAEQLVELQKFRDKLESSIASLTDDLGDDNVAPLYSWLDLVRQKRALAAKVDEALAAVAQARALRLPDGAKTPISDEEAGAQLAHAQGQLDEWKTAMPPAPPPQVVAVWEGKGGDALAESMPRDAMAVGKRGDEARRMLARTAGRSPGKHPWARSRMETVMVPAMGVTAVLLGVFAIATWSGSPATSRVLAALSVSSFVAFAGLLACGVIARRHEQEEIVAAIDWVWHARMYEERMKLAELEAGWLRALVDAQRARKSFDAKAGTGGQLRDFEKWRPDLIDIMLEVARDTEGTEEIT